MTCHLLCRTLLSLNNYYKNYLEKLFVFNVILIACRIVSVLQGPKSKVFDKHTLTLLLSLLVLFFHTLSPSQLKACILNMNVSDKITHKNHITDFLNSKICMLKEITLESIKLKFMAIPSTQSWRNILKSLPSCEVKMS